MLAERFPPGSELRSIEEKVRAQTALLAALWRRRRRR